MGKTRTKVAGKKEWIEIKKIPRNDRNEGYIQDDERQVATFHFCFIRIATRVGILARGRFGGREFRNGYCLQVRGITSVQGETTGEVDKREDRPGLKTKVRACVRTRNANRVCAAPVSAVPKAVSPRDLRSANI